MEILSSVIDTIMPILCSAVSIVLFQEVTNSPPELQISYQIVSVFAICSRPFSEISNIVSSLGSFLGSYKAFKLFLDQTIDKDENIMLNMYLAIKQNTKTLEDILNPKETLETEAKALETEGQDSLDVQEPNCESWELDQSASEDFAIKIVKGEFRVDFTTSKEILTLFFNKNFDLTKTGEEISQKLRESKRLSITNIKKPRLSFLSKSSPVNKEDLNSQKTEEEVEHSLVTVLSNISTLIIKGEKVCISGKSHSGKSMFLLSILKETYHDSGEMYIHGNVRFVSLEMQSFIGGTLRDNIILGNRFEKFKYNRILNLVDLNLENLNGDDFLQVLDNASNLNFEQKWKTILARMLYSEGDIFLFDDFFDELPENERKKVFKLVVMEELKDKTVIFVSNNQEIMKYSSKVIFFGSGKIIEDGKYRELLSRRTGKLKTFMHLKSMEVAKKVSMVYKKAQDETPVAYEGKKIDIKQGSQIFSNILFETNAPKWNLPNNDNKTNKVKKNGNNLNLNINQSDSIFQNILGLTPSPATNKPTIIAINPLHHGIVGKNTISKATKGKTNSLFSALTSRIEKQNKGTITEDYNFDLEFSTWKAFKEMILHSNLIINFVMLTLLFLMNFSLVFIDLWLGLWSLDVLGLNTQYYLVIYLISSIIAAILVFMSEVVFRYLARNGVQRLYSTAIKSLLTSDLGFYSRVPVHRLVFRFTKDIQVVDESLINDLLRVLSLVFFIVFGLIVVLYLTLGFYLIPFIITCYIFGRSLNINMNQSFEFLMISLKQGGEILALLNKLLESNIVLRNFGKENYFDSKMNTFSNNFQNAASHLGNMSQRWLGIRSSLFITLQMLTVLLICIILRVLGGFIGYKFWMISFCVTWIYKVSNRFPKLISTLLSLRNNTISYYRIKEYIQSQDRKKIFVPDIRCKAIEIRDFTYFNLKEDENFFLTLPNFEVKIGTKLAIIGESGSGRHRLIDILLKLKARGAGGKIEDETFRLFGSDIEDIDPCSLRKQFHYLSDSPKLFHSSLIECINRDGYFTEEEVIKAAHFLKFMDLNLIQISRVDTQYRNNKRRGEDGQSVSLLTEINEVMQEENNLATPCKLPIILVTHQNTAVTSFTSNKKIQQKIESKSMSLRIYKNLKNKGLATESIDEIEYSHPYSGQEELSANTKNKKIKSLRRSEEYENYTFPKEDGLLIKSILNQKLDTSLLDNTYSKFFMAVRSFLYKVPMVIAEDSALNFDGQTDFDLLPYFLEYMSKTTFICLVNSVRNLLNFDEIAVMKEGRIVEIGKPSELMNNPNSKLMNIVKKKDKSLWQAMKNNSKNLDRGQNNQFLCGLLSRAKSWGIEKKSYTKGKND